MASKKESAEKSSEEYKNAIEGNAREEIAISVAVFCKIINK